ncbi:MAG: thioester oxidase, partial [Desulfobulbus propionicus]
MFTIKKGREFVKDTIRKEIDFRYSDQHQGVAMPPYQEPVDPEGTRISLPDIPAITEGISSHALFQAIQERKSRRRYAEV